MSGARMRFRIALLALVFTGCTVGPNYRKPSLPVPPEYRGVSPQQTAGSEADSLGDLKWWDAFPDDALRDLIHTALQQNYDLRIAAARIMEARAQLGITRSDQLPTVAAGVSSTNERIAQSTRLPSFETTANQVSVSVAWELDFWGKYRRANESARASLLAQEWAQRQVVSSLVSDLATAYFQLRELDLELEISRQTLDTRKDSLRLTQVLADHGATSMLDVRQAEQLVFAAGASIPDLERRIGQQENLISILIGNNPQAITRGRKLIDQPHAVEIPPGLPSSLLQRRPDIRQAEQQLVAANAQIGVAQADYFPQIVLTASGGYQSSALTGLFSGPAGLWAFGGKLVQPVFEGGRIRNRVKLAQARSDEATLIYKQTVQQAFRDVSDSLLEYQKDREFRVQQEYLTHSAEEATKLSKMRYKGGATSYLEVLDSDTRYFSAQLALSQAELKELQAMVQVYRALGGGWQQEGPPTH